MSGLKPHYRKRYLAVVVGCLIALHLSHQVSQSAQTVATYVPGETYFGRNGYIEYIAGDLPIIISAPHGGYLKPDEIPDRTWGTLAIDTRSQEYAREVADYIYQLTDHRPHVIINRLHRKKLDANRDLPEAAQGHEWAEQAWREYHAFIDAAKNAVVAQHGQGLYLDFHTNFHSEGWNEIGLLLRSSDLDLSDPELDRDLFRDRSSLRNLAYASGVYFPELVRGPSSLGGLLQVYGFETVPSPVHPRPGAQAYLNGGYNTVRHGSREGGSIDGMQVEANRAVLEDDVRDAFSSALAQAIVTFVDTYYGLDPDDGTPTPAPSPTPSPPPPVYSQLPGFPLEIGDEIGRTAPIVADLDGDGHNELLAANRRGEIYAWDAGGAPLPGYPILTEGRITGHLALGDLNGDGSLEIAAGIGSIDAGVEGRVAIWRSDGTPLPGWPRPVDASGIDRPSRINTVALADIDNDSDLEIIAATNNSAAETPGGDAGPPVPNLYAWHHTGEPAAGAWPVAATRGVLGALAVGDANADGQADILVGRDDRFVYAYDARGNPLPGWPVETTTADPGGAAGIVHKLSAPDLADLDGDGEMDIIVAGIRQSPDSAEPVNSDLLVLQSDGARRRRWDRTAEGVGVLSREADLQAAPAVADVNADNELDIVLPTSDGWIRAYRANRTLLWEFNYARGQVIYGSEPVIGDVDDDGFNEIMFGTYDPLAGAAGPVGLWILEHDGAAKGGAPLPVAAPGIMAAPTLADLNGDGRLDIVAAGRAGVIYAWDTGSPVRPRRLPWPVARRDARRTAAFDTAAVRSGAVQILCENQVYDGYTSKLFVLDAGVDQDPAIQKVIRNCTFRNSAEPAIVIANARNVLIEGNVFENIRTNIPGDGVHAINIPCRRPCQIDTIVIRDNTFTAIGADGIQLGEEGRAIRNIVIENNVFSGSADVGENGVDVKGVDGPIYIIGNTLRGFRPCESPKLGGAQDCSGSHGPGIVVHRGRPSGAPRRVSLESNRFVNNIYGLMVSGNAEDILVRDNAFEGNRLIGIYVRHVESISVLGNTFARNPRQIQIHHTPVLNGPCVVRDNQFDGVNAGLVLVHSVCSADEP